MAGPTEAETGLIEIGTAGAQVPAAPSWMTMAMESRGPFYLQLCERVRAAIASGELKAGSPLPSERDLSVALTMSRTTIRKALSVLAEEGLLEQRHGSGTFVRQKLETSLRGLRSFSQEMQARGLVPSSEVLSKAVGQPNPEEILALNISLGTRVFRLDRIRYADGVPMAIERVVMNQRFIGNPDAIGHSLYETLRLRGFAPVRALQRMRAGAINAVDAQLLGLGEGTPVLLLERRSYLADGTVVEQTKSTYRGDAYEFVAELHTLEQFDGSN
jgi:GntR family transcriptional regulator